MDKETEEYGYIELMIIQEDANIVSAYDYEVQNDDDDDEDDEEVGETKTSSISYACEDCDYRWDATVETYNVINQYSDEGSTEYCPMCGSFNTLQI